MTYDVELVAIDRAPPIPEDLAAPPADAPKTASGIAYRTLQAGTGKEHPTQWDRVTIHFSGWNKVGQMFATTMMKKKPQTFPVYRQGPVWAEVLATMVVGQKSRFWVPAEVVQRKQGALAGAQVYDIELLAMKKQKPAPAVPADVAAPPKDAKKTAGGVHYKRVKRGSGKKKPTDRSLVTIHFTTWNTKGQLSDSSVVRDEPVEYAMNRLPIPAWAEVLKQMVAGEVTHAWVPPEKMPQGKSRRPRRQMSIFQLELLRLRPRPEPPPAPKHVAKPPKQAKKTDKGVWYVLLKKGSGKKRPAPTDNVRINYTAWQSDGTRIDSSIPTGKPAELRLSRGRIEGLRHAVQTMVVGEQKRFWIPEELAYKGKKGRPAGMLVYDVELVEIR
jgi:peptidylprolyl isomerase